MFNNIKNWFNKLPPNQQLFVLLVCIIAGYILFKRLKGQLNLLGNKVESLGEEAYFKGIGQRKSYNTTQYKSFADTLYYAMKGPGTNETAIGDVFSKMYNDLDVIAVTNAFGIRDKEDLTQWLRGDLSTSEMERYVNGILRAKGITKTF